MKNTAQLREQLPQLIDRFAVRSMLDAPCGDFGWMATLSLPLERYIGADIVPELIADNISRFTPSKGRKFAVIDIVQDQIPQVDLIFCRDCWIHLSFVDALCSLANFKRSDSTYLMTTTYPGCARNLEMRPGGGFRPLNLSLPPFLFPEPILLIDDGDISGPDRGNKAMGLWKLSDLPETPLRG